MIGLMVFESFPKNNEYPITPRYQIAIGAKAALAKKAAKPIVTI
jgi:hypothetical protein